MKEIEPLFSIWNDRISIAIKGKGIFKIYFQDFPNYCYFGLTGYQDGSNLKYCLKIFKLKLWKIFSGISGRENLAQQYLLTWDEYCNLTKDQRLSYNQKIARKRKENLLKFGLDVLPTEELKFWKIIIFGEMHSLSLTDLRFEVLVQRTKNDDFENLITQCSSLIRKTESWLKGFNSDIMIDYYYNRQHRKVKSTESLNKMLKILSDKTGDSYEQWHCYWNLYQIFKTSFFENPFGWLAFWNEISLPEIAQDFEQLTRLIFHASENQEMPNPERWSSATIETLKNSSHKNAEIILTNHDRISFKEKINLDQWIANDTNYFLKTCAEQNLVDEDFFQFYLSWEIIENFFTNNPFKNTEGFQRTIQFNFQFCHFIISELKTPANDLLRLYHNLVFSYRKNNLNLSNSDLLIDYYFQKNFLNPFLFR